MPAKLEPPSVVRTIAPQIPGPVRHRALPSNHHSSRLTAVNEVAWKSAGITPPAGTGDVVVVEPVESVVDVVDEVSVDEVEVDEVEVDEVEIVVELVVVVVVGVLLQAAPARARAAKATPNRPRRGPIRPPVLCILFMAGRTGIAAPLLSDDQCAKRRGHTRYPEDVDLLITI